MKLVLIYLAAVSLLELSLYIPVIWRFRHPVAAINLVLLSIATGLLVGNNFALWGVLFLVFSLYRIVNMLRIVENRTQQDYLYSATRKSSLFLIAFQIGLLLLIRLNFIFKLSINMEYVLYLIIILTIGLMALIATIRNIKKTRFTSPEADYADRDLPTVTIAIPARNETDDLNICLTSLIGSNYPKLEILVLDDCSQEKRTPEIIRSFAHDGVRFIAGKIPPQKWLAKNFAYNQLATESNGEIIIFCGVDTRFESETIRSIVEVMLKRNKSMISVIPINKMPEDSKFVSFLIQPTRYAWELCMPRRHFNRPPVLSTCWFIRRSLLDISGGFEAVHRSAIPERYFAKQASKQEDGYSFIQTNTENETILRSDKTLTEQRSTAIRTRYPQLHKRPELICIVSMLELFCFLIPYVALIERLYDQSWGLSALLVFVCIGNIIFFSKIVNLTYHTFVVRGLFLGPFAIIYDVILLNYSMWRYEFNEVIWKDRNVCIPVMHTYKSLLDIPGKS